MTTASTLRIAAQFPLTAAQQAHERQAAGHVLGKILLQVL